MNLTQPTRHDFYNVGNVDLWISFKCQLFNQLFIYYSCRALTCIAIQREAMQSDRWQHSRLAKRWCPLTCTQVSVFLLFCKRRSTAEWFLPFLRDSFLIHILSDFIFSRLQVLLSHFCVNIMTHNTTSVKEEPLMNEFCCYYTSFISHLHRSQRLYFHVFGNFHVFENIASCRLISV